MKKTLGRVVAGIRRKNALTMLETALKCDLSETVVWKLEKDRPVRWETVHTILSLAFNIHSHEALYQTVHHLWLEQRNKKAEEISPLLNERLLSKHGVEATRKFRKVIHGMSREKTKKVLEALLWAIQMIADKKPRRRKSKS